MRERAMQQWAVVRHSSMTRRRCMHVFLQRCWAPGLTWARYNGGVLFSRTCTATYTTTQEACPTLPRKCWIAAAAESR